MVNKLVDFLHPRLRWAISIGLAALLGVGWLIFQGYQAARAREQSLAALRTERVKRGDLVSVVSATGSILPEQGTDVFFLVPGIVVEVRVDSGDSVQAGQVLARLDDAELRLAVRQAEDALSVAQLNRKKLLDGPSQGDIEAAKANLRSANAAVSDLLNAVKPEDVAIVQLKYNNAQDVYQKAANKYNDLVQFSADHPRFAASQDTLTTLKLSMEADYYQAEIARQQLLQTQQGADKGSLSVAYARVAQAKAQLDQLKAPPSALQVKRADLAVEQAQTALDQAKLRASRAELTAPYAGVVAVVNVKVGESTGAGVPAIVMVDTHRFHLDVTVDEVDVAQLAVGQPVSVLSDALPGIMLTGKVDRIAPTATVTAGVANYLVRLVLDPTAAPLRAGMSATASITVAEVKNVLLVPNWAIRRDRRTGQAYASLKVGEQLTEVPITTGLRGEAYTEVTSGVKVGDLAAISTARDQLNLFGGGQ